MHRPRCVNTLNIKRRSFLMAWIIFLLLFVSYYHNGVLVQPGTSSVRYDAANDALLQVEPMTQVQQLLSEIGTERSSRLLVRHEDNFKNRILDKAAIEKLFFYDRNRKETAADSVENTPEAHEWKRILFFSQDFSENRYHGVGGRGNETFLRNHCPEWRCEVFDYLDIGHNVTIAVEQFDAVVFHEPNWAGNRKVPEKRSPHQRYVFWSQESPDIYNYRPQWDGLKGFFNWTMTYRWDSDIIHPYGWIVPKNPELVPMKPGPSQLNQLIAEEKAKRTKNHADGKTKMVAWFVSHCNTPSGRDDYVDRLRKFVDVDIYGRCGTHNCSKSDDGSCRKMMERDYKFYIAFENSLCLDYATEKFFEQIKYNIILIVLDVHGNQARFAPPHSYINALDFPSVKELADYLIMLDSNDDLYNEYFWWRNHYEVRNQPEDFRHGLCHFCSVLHRPVEPVKVYQDLTDWWAGKSQCKSLEFPQSSESTVSDTSASNADPFVWSIKSGVSLS